MFVDNAAMMLLRSLASPDATSRIEGAAGRAIVESATAADLGGASSTRVMGDALLAHFA
ncbi:MAG: hypothetical protein ABIQ19_00605 [Sphingomonas sp.]